MQVSFNPAITNNYKNMSFGKAQQAKDDNKKYTEKEIQVAKTKKAISECATIVVGIGILYFAMKRNFRVNGIKSIENKAKKTANIPKPEIKLTLDKINASKNFI